MNLQLGYDYLTIGLLFMMYNAASAAATFLSLRQPLSYGRAAALTAVSILASAALAPSGFLFPALLFALAMVRGFGIGFFEHTVVKVVKDSKNLSVDVGLLHVPMRIGEFSSVLAAGFAVQFLGYTPVFFVTGLCFGLFLAVCLWILKEP